MKNNIVEETNFIMKKYHIKANKSLGQNFLINQEVIDTIVNKSEITENDLVIEIGPGLGTLTKYLLEKAGKVICIELDKRMIDILEDRFKLYDNFEIINQDVLKVDLNQLIKEQPAYGNIICRCEMITEGEIIDAIRRPLGAKSLDGVKRRTRAGMGRCQAGFCSPKTMEILERELKLSMFDITKCGGKSNIVVGVIKDSI